MSHLRFAPILLVSMSLLAQSTGRISGVVIDPSSAAIPGAKVDLILPGGASPVATTNTGAGGNFSFSGLQPVHYDVIAEQRGFRKAVVRRVKVDPGIELAMKPLQLELSSQAEVIEVVAEAQTIQTANAQISATVTNLQITRLPSLNRSPLAFITLQAGVSDNGRATTTINGLRPSFANVTIDGINIQDNFIRTNTLDFQPNMLQLDQVAEFTLSTSNTNAALGNGAAQLSFVTPSGGNALHGNLRWFNRNNAASANTWFNNRNRVARPFLNQNQFGGSLSGKIVRDKLFFYADFEGTRLRQQIAATPRTILTADARNGIFTYRDLANNIQRVNLLSLFPGLARSQEMQQILSAIPGPERINRTDIGDGLNTGGYSFNIRNNRTRDNVTAKLDYFASTRHSFSGTYIWNRDIIDRADLSNDYSLVPKASNDNQIRLASLTHRWSPLPSFTHEARFGFNLAPGIFATSENFGSRIITIPLAGNPLNTFRAQGRYTDTYNYSSGATWTSGGHTLSFGAQGMIIHADPFNDAGNLPQYSINMSAAMAGRFSLPPLLPGIRAQDQGLANSLLALHTGMITSATQQFNATSRSSGFVGGATQARKLRQNNVAFYINDAWKISRKLTLTAGTRWEYWSPVDEAGALVLFPVIPNGGNAISTLLSNATLDFAGNAVGRPWYKRDWNNFGPNVGLAWQPFGDGKTVVRSGYSINFPNDELIRSIDNSAVTNAGLSQTQNSVNLTSFIDSAPAIPAPAFKVPRTLSDNYALNRASAMAIPDPGLVIPYVQQWNLSIQREIQGGVLELRYIGNRSTKQFRAFDYNQVLVRENGFLTDFLKAFSNLRLSQTAGRGNNAAYNPAVAGSQPLPFFDRLPQSGQLANPTIVNLINTHQAGELATQYQELGINGAVNFYRNPFGLGMNMMTNYSNANYNAVQVDYTRRFRSGWQVQANYTYAKVMSDSAGDGQTRFEPFLDNDNPRIERSRTPFDLTHAFKFNGIYELPWGSGRRFAISNRVVDAVLGGWGISGLMTLQSGAPFSVNSGRGTLNRSARSGANTANTPVNKSQLDELLRFRHTGNGPYFAAASVTGADGRAVAPDGSAFFAGQVFSNPTGGSLGGLQRRMFSGPRFWNTNFQIFKTFRFQERYSADLRADFFNLTNTPSFLIGDQSINSVNFGRITSTASERRLVQFGLYFRF